MMDRELLEKWRAEEAAPFEGWDFSHLEGRMFEETLSWDYASVVRETFTNTASLLDMGTGGGEFLSGLGTLPANTHATEGYAPNIPVARARLEPPGIRVHEVGEDDRLPVHDESFDLVINRHESYDPSEVRRVLRPGGCFITQQVGGSNDIRLNELLAAPDSDFGMPHWNLEFARKGIEDGDFVVTTAKEEFPIIRFTDVGAIVFYLKAIPWQIPDFTVNRRFDRLKTLENRIRDEGSIVVRGHRFLVVARK